MRILEIRRLWLSTSLSLIYRILLATYAEPVSAMIVTESQKLVSNPSDAGTLFGYSSAISGNTAIVGAHSEDGGAAYIFERNIDGIWSQVSRLTAYGSNPGDGFGISVAIDGNLALVGGRGVNFTGGAWSFQRDSLGQWSPAGKLPAFGLALGDFFGNNVAISGDVALVGANHDTNRGRDAGAAYFFHRDSSGVWTQTSKVYGNDTNSRDIFGGSVSLDGNTAVIGGLGHEAAYVFQAGTSGTWEQIARLQARDPGQKQFGIDVSIDGPTIVVGANYDNTETGATYVFEEVTDDNWSQVAKLLAPDAAIARHFGESVAVSGNLLIAGSTYDDLLAGSAHIFAKGASGWQLRSTLQASDRATEDLFYRVSLDGQTAFVGAWRDDHDGFVDAGAAYVFESIPEPTAIAYTIAAIAPGILRRRKSRYRKISDG